MLKILILFRLVSRFLVYFVKELEAGNPYAIAVLSLGLITGGIWVMIRYFQGPKVQVRQEATRVDAMFRDDTNPYRTP